MADLMYGECPRCHGALTAGHNYSGTSQFDPWNYFGSSHPKEGDDARKLVTLLEGGMVWVGIRAYHHTGKYWTNNGEPERAEVLAWMNLPQPAQKRWAHGILA
jgi:hypothetical protein